MILDALDSERRNQMNALEKLYKNYYEKMHTDQIIPLLGMINGSEILFVGQNPGIPFQKEHIALFTKFKESSYEKQQSVFKESWNKSKFVIFIKQICINIGLNFDNNCGLTNIVKYWTPNNSKPDITQLDQETLRDEIKTIDPRVVIFLSRFAYNNFIYRNEFDNLFPFSHPAAERYSKEYLETISKDIMRRIEECAKH